MKSSRARLSVLNRAALVVAPALALQWPVLHLLFHPMGLPWEPLLPGIAIFASAYLLSWAAEVAEADIPPALALGLLALVAVAPEYAVDVYFAWKGGQDPSYIPFATANMTGANRLLIGMGWAMVVLVYGWKYGKREVKLDRRLRLETAVLFAGALYCLAIPLKGTLSLWDAVFLTGLFVFYFFRLLKSGAAEPAVEGPVAVIQRWPAPLRRAFTASFFIFSAVSIYLASHPFAEGLIEAGRRLGMDQFVLVQWLAPLASESPEFIVAAIFALKSRPTAGFNTILSSTVNQWTLLIGMLPLVYTLSKGGIHPMALDGRQAREIFLTSTQCLFGVVVLSNLRFSFREAVALFLLFITQSLYPLLEPWVGLPAATVREAYAWLYLGLSLGTLVASNRIRVDFRELLGVFFRRR
ncbi:MAG TPA: sodium:calcium antiporter [bacterium]|nr:sodium:calcium antiporter [bacterium]